MGSGEAAICGISLNLQTSSLWRLVCGSSLRRESWESTHPDWQSCESVFFLLPSLNSRAILYCKKETQHYRGAETLDVICLVLLLY
ncbi:uncharacterized protein LJ206_015171 isoform 2-T2 [Theristicus caerulescens]